MISYQYKQAYPFVNGVATAQNFDGKWCILRERGRVQQFLDYDHLSEPRSSVMVSTLNGLKGVQSIYGPEIFMPTYKSVSIIDSSTFIFKDQGLYGLWSRGGYILHPEYEKMYEPARGCLRVREDGKYYYLHGEGYKSKKGPYDRAVDFHYDNTVVKTPEGYQLIDSAFNIINSLPYAKVDYLGEEKWKYKEGGKWGVLSSAGEVLCAAEYELMNRYQEGRLAVSVDDKWGYLDEHGQLVIPMKYPLAWDYVGGKARFIYDRGIGFIDKSGKKIIDDKFYEVRDFHNGRARFQSLR